MDSWFFDIPLVVFSLVFWCVVIMILFAIAQEAVARLIAKIRPPQRTRGF